MKNLKPIDLSPRGSDTAHALAWGLIAAAVLIAGIVVGSRGFKDFDPALVSYAGATVFSAFGLGYRYSMWLRRPPTRLYWFRGWQIFLQPRRLPGNIARLAGIFWSNVVLQRFIERRSKTRWTAHWFLAWGCLIAAAVTFPLSFGWIRFETAPDNQANLSRIRFRDSRRQLSPRQPDRSPGVQHSRYLRCDGANWGVCSDVAAWP
jgi:hypothetical protein